MSPYNNFKADFFFPASRIVCIKKRIICACTAVTDSRWDNYSKYLKSLYKAKTLATSSDDQWPPLVTHKIFRLAMI